MTSEQPKTTFDNVDINTFYNEYQKNRTNTNYKFYASVDGSENKQITSMTFDSDITPGSNSYFLNIVVNNITYNKVLTENNLNSITKNNDGTYDVSDNRNETHKIKFSYERPTNISNLASALSSLFNSSKTNPKSYGGKRSSKKTQKRRSRKNKSRRIRRK